jgi:16S rRNA (cytidine1402-2'-O)-methyltransferase
MLEVFGDREICLARELTKLHEEFLRGKISTMIEKYAKEEIRGEFVLVVSGASDQNGTSEVTETEVRAAIRAEFASNRSVKDISALLADQFHWKKSDVYRLALDEQQNSRSE